MTRMRVRPALPDEAARLSELALRSKAHWGYDADFLEACRDELSLTGDDFNRLTVRVADDDGHVAGFSAVEVIDDDIVDVTLLFVDPPFVGAGVGRLLFEDLVATARTSGALRLQIDSDPHASGFYERMGATFVDDVASGSIPGRLLPRYSYRLE